MVKHWAIVLVVFVLGLASSTALADGGIGLRWSLAWPGLSAHARAASPGLHVSPEPSSGDVSFAPSYSLVPPPGSALASRSQSEDIPSGVSFYYGLSRSEAARSDRSLYQLVSPSGSASQTMGFTLKYPF